MYSQYPLATVAKVVHYLVPTYSAYGEHRMALVPDLAEFVSRADWQTLSNNARRRLKIRLVDSLGCAIGALEGGSISVVVRY